MIRSKHKECPVCDYPFFNADEATRTQYFGTVFKKRCPNCGTFFEYSHNEKFDDYPCDSCLRKYWRDGSLPNWEPRK